MTPIWALAPFLIYVVLIAALPVFCVEFWDDNRNKLTVALLAAAPVLGHLIAGHDDAALVLLDTAREYAAFMTLIGALFVISGGVCLRGALAGTPRANTAFLAAGAVLASAIGTAAASALLIRPLLRSNQHRQRRRHIVIFFIFIVCNAGGLLTPLGDPSLLLGYLRGVPFEWTLRLAGPWALINGALLAIFALIDRFIARTESASQRAPGAQRDPLRIDGASNLVWLLAAIATVLVLGTAGRHWLPDPATRRYVQIAAMVMLATLSLATTPRWIHAVNRFSWAPLREMAAVFAGIFVTMVPALALLHDRAADLGITQPLQFFWAAGALSSVLDSAPTYLALASLATGVADAGTGQLSALDLGALAAHPVGQHLLAAVSCGSVLMAAATYIGNGPNLMIKAIAEQHHVRMPSFFGYTLWSLAILVPLLGAVALVFLP